jgi:hypothetical protein
VRSPGDVISYLQMCQDEGVNLQQGMNFRLRGRRSVILMSLRPGPPYADAVQDDGRVLIYEGTTVLAHAAGLSRRRSTRSLRRRRAHRRRTASSTEAARRHADDGETAELVQVYEKMRTGIWVYNGAFRLVDTWAENIDGRRVFKFRLEVAPDQTPATDEREPPLDQNRMIPTAVKLEVWRRDGGRCVRCGSADNLHFDHIIPYSRGGSSLTTENVQLLCARHNLAKRDQIE